MNTNYKIVMWFSTVLLRPLLGPYILPHLLSDTSQSETNFELVGYKHTKIYLHVSFNGQQIGVDMTSLHISSSC